MPLPVLRFRRDETITAVPGDGVFITTEQGSSTRLHGPAVTAAHRLLDGTLTRGEVLEALTTTLGPSDASRALAALLRSGHVIEADPEVDLLRAGYFEQLGADGSSADTAVSRLADARVDLLALGAARDLDLSALLAPSGLAHRIATHVEDVPDDAALLLVATDDYLRPELREINRYALGRGMPWMPVKPLGRTVWTGPLVVPGVSACFECLHVRLASKQLSRAYFQQRGVIGADDVGPATGLASSAALAVAAAAHRVLLHLALGEGADVRQGDVTTIDTATLTTERHRLDPRPQCPVCGDPSVQETRMVAPVVLRPTPKAATSDGGHRALGPEAFVAEYERFVSPITGPVSHLTAIPPAGDGLHVYTAGQNFSVPMRGLADLRAGLRSLSCGKGKTAVQAKASALGEAIERYSGLFHGDEPRRAARLADLDPAEVVHPNDIHQFSDAQFRDRAVWNARPSHFHWVGDRLRENEEVEWTPVHSLTAGRTKLLPTSMLFYAYASDRFRYNGSSNSNGCAAGASLEDAILQGFFELVERDATAIWWYNRLQRPRIDLDSFDDPYIAEWQQQYRRLHRETWVLDLTTDLGVPTVAAISRRFDKPAEDVLFSLGSHFDLSIAVGRALSEMNQFIGPVAHMPTDGSGEYRFTDAAQVDFWKQATVVANPWLAPHPALPAVAAGGYPDRSSADLAADVRLARSLVEQAGMELLVLDQTRVDIGLPVVRVIVPGLRHFWPRYAPGRLFDVPVRMGWLDRATREEDLNPIGVFI